MLSLLSNTRKKIEKLYQTIMILDSKEEIVIALKKAGLIIDFFELDDENRNIGESQYIQDIIDSCLSDNVYSLLPCSKIFKHNDKIYYFISFSGYGDYERSYIVTFTEDIGILEQLVLDNSFMRIEHLNNCNESQEVIKSVMHVANNCYALFKNSNLETDFSIVLSKVKDLIDDDAVTFLWVYNPHQQDNELVLRCSSDASVLKEWQHHYIPFKSSLTGMSCENKDIKYYDEIPKEHINYESAIKLGMEKLIVVPVYSSDDKFLGAINIYPSNKFKRHPKVDTFLVVYSRVIGLFFENLEAKDVKFTINNLINFYSNTYKYSSVEKLMKVVVQRLKESDFFGVEASTIFVEDSENDVFKVAATTGFSEGDIYPIYKNLPSEGLTGMVLNRKQTIIVHDLPKDSRVSNRAKEKTKTPLRTWIGVPIVDKSTNQVLGAIRCINKLNSQYSRVPEFTKFDQTVLEMIAHFLSVQILQIKILKNKQQIIEEQDDFLISISHELNSPLHGILGIADNVDARYCKMEEKEQRLIVDDLVNLCFHMSFIAGQFSLQTLQEEEFDYRDVLNRIAKLLSPSAKEKYIDIERDYKNVKIPQVIADPTRVQQLIYNLLNNAIKYSDGSGDVSIDVQPLQDGSLRTSVINFGPGIPEGEEHIVFEKYKRLSNVAYLHSSGTGVGLYYCKKIVDEFGGKIWVSNLAKPTVFTFLMPREVVKPTWR